MSQIDVLRPVSVRKAGAATAVPSGTLSAVTSDNNDATYIDFNDGASGNWSLRVGSHTPASGYQRHAVRGRVRARTDTGSIGDDIDLGRGEIDYITYDVINVGATFAEHAIGWSSNTAFGLATAGALADLNIGGGYVRLPDGGATELRTAECYVDVDCRLRPQYTPEVRDDAGTNRAGGTVTDTTQPTLFFGGATYDDLPALDWSVVVVEDFTGDAVFSASGSGTPPLSTQVTGGLSNSGFTATFTVRSTIRGADPFEHVQVLTFEVDNEVPPPSPPLLQVRESFGGYEVSWSDPGGQGWDEEFPLLAELWRDDCTGSQRIATIPNGLNGAYLDLAIPQRDVRQDCEPAGIECDITYRVRYWGYVSTTVTIPETIPVDLVLGWPGSVASIPDGWTRVTSLDGYFPRGATGTGAPSATGGSTSHTHTTPAHRHVIGAHSHDLTGNTAGSSTSTTTARFNGADRPTANQSHTHPLPDRTGTAVAFSSGQTAAGVNSVANDPPTYEVIWIRPDGTETSYPPGILGWSTESVSGWTADATGRGRFLRGAGTALAGGNFYGSETHHHTVAAHTHTGASHDHTIANTGLSNPAAASEAEAGGASPRWLPRHTHLMNVVPTSTGNLITSTGGNTSTATREPRHRRLRLLRNTGGGAQTRIIGLYTGALADLDPVLTLCDGRNGTPDMRGLFCRDIGTGSVNSLAGADTHLHTTPNHTHAILPHRHETQVGAATGQTFERRTSGDQGNVPTTSHTHDSGDTVIATPSISSSGAGATNTVSHVPPYKEAHFVRVDGTVAGGDLPVPQLKTTDYASVTVPAMTYTDGLDRISSPNDRMAIGPDRSYTHLRQVADSVPITGGVHSVSNTTPVEDMVLTIAVEGLPALERLEAILRAERVYFSPLGGTPGWYESSAWTVNSPTRDVKVVQVTLARIAWPQSADPEELI